MGNTFKNNDAENMINGSYDAVEKILFISKFNEYGVQLLKTKKDLKKKQTAKLFLFV